MVPPRTLRCANAMLYAGFTVIVLAAAVYVALFRGYGMWGYIGSAAACLVALVWGGYYVTLRYEVDATGISRRLPGSCTTIRWQDLTCAELRETHTPEIDSSTLHLESAGATIDLGSDLLTLEAVRALAQDLNAAGLLTSPIPARDEEEI